MNGYCGSCGSPVPKGQRYCSMCVGDPWHGNDGYYLRELERAEANRQEYNEIMRQERECMEGES